MKWKILGIVCAIVFLVYLFLIFCESVQDNGMIYTFHYCLRALLGIVIVALAIAFTMCYFTFIPKYISKLIIGNNFISYICNMLYCAVFLIALFWFLKIIGPLGKEYDSYISFQKYVYRLERNIGK
jgi:hypothetical protein